MMANASEMEVIPSTLVEEDPTFADLVEEFVDSLDDQVRNMKIAVESSDFAGLRMLAHRLKSSGGGHGYRMLTEKASALEKNSLNEDLKECSAGVEELAGIIARVVIKA